MAMGGADANLGIDSEIGVNAEIQSGLKIPPYRTPINHLTYGSN